MDVAQRFPKLVPAWQRSGNVLAGVHDSDASYLIHRAGRAEPFAVVAAGPMSCPPCLQVLSAPCPDGVRSRGRSGVAHPANATTAATISARRIKIAAPANGFAGWRPSAGEHP